MRCAERADFVRVLDAIAQEGTPLLGVVHLWNLDAPQGTDDVAVIEPFQVIGCASAVALVQALAGQERARMPRLTIVTRGAQSPDGRRPALAQAPAWGLGRVIAEEHPECWSGLVDLDPTESTAVAAARLLPELLAPEGDDGIAFGSGGARFALRLQAFAPATVTPFAARADGAYLVTGGLGGVGLETARWLAERGARHLVLAGRSGMPPRAQWDGEQDAATRGRIEAIGRIEALGATVYPESLDAADAAAVDRLLRAPRADARPPIRGIVHAAAVADDCLIDKLDVASLRKVLRPKLVAAAVLAEASSGLALDFFVMYSSLGSLLGQPGQASYAAANAYLDALALVLRQRGVPALAVNWGAWKELGLAQTEGARRTIEELERRGIRGFTARGGTEALGHLLEGGAVCAAVAPADWQRFAEVASRTRVPTIVRDLCQRAPAAAAPQATTIRNQLDAAAPADRGALLLAHLRTQLGEVLRLPVAKVEAEAPMGTLGLESLTALEFRKRLETALGSRLSATVMWNYPTLAALGGYLLGRMYSDSAVPAAAAAAAPGATHGAATAPPAAAPQGEQMSEEDAIKALLGETGAGR